MAKSETALAKIVPAEQPFLQEFAQELGTTAMALWTVSKQCIKSSKGARQATTEEQFVFLMTCKKYDLNPMLKEAYGFIGKEGRLCTGIGIDGWLKIANRHPEMDGLETQPMYTEKDKLKGYTATVWRKDRTKPFTVPEFLDECYRDTEQWNARPHRMMRHKAVIQAIRYAFAITGLSDIEEAQEAARNADLIAEVPSQHTLKMPADLAGEVPWEAETKEAETRQLVEGIGRPIVVESQETARMAVEVGKTALRPVSAATMLQEDVTAQEVDEPAGPEPDNGEEGQDTQIEERNGPAGSDLSVKPAPAGLTFGPGDAYEVIAFVCGGGLVDVRVGRHSTKGFQYQCSHCNKLDAARGESCPHLTAALAFEQKAKEPK